MNETSGSVSVDSSPQLNNGQYTGVDLANTPAPPRIGGSAPLFDGANDSNNIFSAGLAADFNGAEGAAIIWLKPVNVGVWGDGVTRYIFRASVDGSNYFAIDSQGNNDRVQFIYTAGGVGKNYYIFAETATAWTMYALVWSKAEDRVTVFRNNVEKNELGTLGTWVGNINAAWIGAFSSANGVWNGWMCQGMLLNRPATDAELIKVYNLGAP
jgi:hypothetical protein